jgi:hypothetical protein
VIIEFLMALAGKVPAQVLFAPESELSPTKNGNHLVKRRLRRPESFANFQPCWLLPSNLPSNMGVLLGQCGLDVELRLKSSNIHKWKGML